MTCLLNSQWKVLLEMDALLAKFDKHYSHDYPLENKQISDMQRDAMQNHFM